MAPLAHLQSERDFIAKACALLSATIVQSITARGYAVLGFSGGSTPKPIYEALGGKLLPWDKVWIFLIDDRYIRADDPKSNQFLLRSTLLKNAPVPESNLIFPDTSLPIDACISLYDEHLSALLKKSPADIVTLGLGEDGHIASLFPLLSQDAFGPKTVIHTTTDQFDVHDRISVTLPVITGAKQKLFLLRGEAKKDVWEEMINNKDDEHRWPAKAVLASGSVTALLQI